MSLQKFASSLIRLIPTEDDRVKEGQGKLDRSVAEAITEYERLCIPSSDYPIVEPICL